MNPSKAIIRNPKIDFEENAARLVADTIEIDFAQPEAPAQDAGIFGQIETLAEQFMRELHDNAARRDIYSPLNRKRGGDCSRRK